MGRGHLGESSMCVEVGSKRLSATPQSSLHRTGERVCYLSGVCVVGLALVACAPAGFDAPPVVSQPGPDSPQPPPSGFVDAGFPLPVYDAGGSNSDAATVPPSPSPLTEEVCGDGIDNNQDGRVDEMCPCEVGQTQACWPGDPALRGMNLCQDGQQQCTMAGEFGAWGECTGATLPDPMHGCNEPPNQPTQCENLTFSLMGSIRVLATRGGGSSGNSCQPTVNLNYSRMLPDGAAMTTSVNYSGGIFEEFDSQGCDRGRFHLQNVEVSCFTGGIELKKVHIKYDSGCYSCSRSGFVHLDDFIWDAAAGGGSCTPQPDGSVVCNGSGQRGNMTIQNLVFRAM